MRIAISVKQVKSVYVGGMINGYIWDNGKDTIYITKRWNGGGDKRYNDGEDYWGFMMPNGDDAIIDWIE